MFDHDKLPKGELSARERGLGVADDGSWLIAFNGELYSCPEPDHPAVVLFREAVRKSRLN